MKTQLNIEVPETFSLNKTGVEVNELNMKAQGGTELMQQALYERLSPDLKDKFQIICSRVRHLDGRPPIVWLHDLAQDPEAERFKDPKFRELFRVLIFVSHWQQQQYHDYLGVPFGGGVVLRNAIVPIESHTKPTDKIRLIYHTTPHRGLNILVSAFQRLAEKHKDIELDVYSSFKLYGWESRDEPFQQLFDICRQHPQINYHGAVPNQQIREALRQAHIFAYPSIWQETSCIAGIEALSAQCMMVCPSLAALPETTAGFAMMYPFTENLRDHEQQFTAALEVAINSARQKSPSYQAHLRFQKMYFDTLYDWNLRIQEWESVLRQL